MQVRIEFYRTRDGDEAHAVLGRATREAADLDEAVALARSLLHSLPMPQRPDAVTICDDGGTELCRCAVDHRNDGNLLAAGELLIEKGHEHD
jgi:hypothetical protein